MLSKPLQILRAERYDIILAICTVTVVLTVTGIEALTALSGVVGLVLIVATLIESSQRRDRRTRAWLVLALLMVVAAVELAFVHRSDALLGPAVVMSLGFVAAATVTRQVLSRPLPSTTSIAASACAYLLFGYSFGSLYLLIDRAASATFLASGEALTPESAIYFSFVTLTTLGFGDLTPAASAGRIVVTLEAMAGQFYIAIAVARLVAGMAAPQTVGDD